MDKKRIIFAIGFVILSVAIGFALYYVFFAPRTPRPETPTEVPTQVPTEFPAIGTGTPTDVSETPPTELPIIGELPVDTGLEALPEIEEIPPVRQLVEDRITSPDAAGAKGVKYYNNQDGKFYRIAADGSVRTMSDQVFFNVDNVTWSPVNDESIIEYPDGANIYYNFETKRQVTLPKHWDDFSFSPQGNQIAAKSLGFSKENRWLISSAPDGSSVELLEPMGDNANKVIVDWSPNEQVVALSRTGDALGAYRQEVLFIGKYGENFPSTVVEGRGLETTWSENGDTLLYSVFNPDNNYNPQLWVASGASESLGSGRKLLNVNTWADKCTFSDDRFVYCGVPQTLENGAGFVPDLANFTQDDLYKIDTKTGLKTQIDLDEFHTIESIFVSEDNTKLFFTDKNQDGLFEVDI